MSPHTPRLTPARALLLARRLRSLSGDILLDTVLNAVPDGRVAVVSSFGIESAVLLHLVARVDRSLPVIFVDTGRLFPETLAYRDQLIDRLRLTGVRTVAADAAPVGTADPDGELYRRDPDGCCQVRKVVPYAQALSTFDVEVTGRKRSHGAARTGLDEVEVHGARLKINPLAGWSPSDVESAFDKYDLPRHPLSCDGFASVGCTTCTRRVANAEPLRAGRWAGTDKTECGIHFAFTDGVMRAVRTTDSTVKQENNQ